MIYEFAEDKNVQSITEGNSLAKQQNKPTNRSPSLPHSLIIQYQAALNFPHFPIFTCMCVFAADTMQLSYYQEHLSFKKRVSQSFKAQGLEEMPILSLVKFLLTLKKDSDARYPKRIKESQTGSNYQPKSRTCLGPSDYFQSFF